VCDPACGFARLFEVAHPIKMQGREAEMGLGSLDAGGTQSTIELSHRPFGMKLDLFFSGHEAESRLAKALIRAHNVGLMTAADIHPV
jgi:hypothetical protein